MTKVQHDFSDLVDRLDRTSRALNSMIAPLRIACYMQHCDAPSSIDAYCNSCTTRLRGECQLMLAQEVCKNNALFLDENIRQKRQSH